MGRWLILLVVLGFWPAYGEGKDGQIRMRARENYEKIAIHTPDQVWHYESFSHTYAEPGTYVVKLSAFSKNETKESIAEKVIEIDNAPLGHVTFWTQSSANDIAVYIGQETASITTTYPGGVNDCHLSGCANFSLLRGVYQYQAYDLVTGSNHGSYFYVETDSCTKVLLNF